MLRGGKVASAEHVSRGFPRSGQIGVSSSSTSSLSSREGFMTQSRVRAALHRRRHGDAEVKRRRPRREQRRNGASSGVSDSDSHSESVVSVLRLCSPKRLSKCECAV